MYGDAFIYNYVAPWQFAPKRNHLKFLIFHNTKNEETTQ